MNVEEYILKIRHYKSKTIANMLYIGLLLTEAKIDLNHGEFLMMLKHKYVNMSIRTYQRFLSLYKNYGHLIDNIEELETMNLTQLLSYAKPNNEAIYTNGKIDLDKLKEFHRTTKLARILGIKLVPKSEISDDYFSGLFDGEGSLGIYSTGPKTFNFILSISNNDKNILESFQKKYDIGLISDKQNNHYVLTSINTIDIKRCLDKLRLYIKHEQKETMLEAIKLYTEDYIDNYHAIAKLAAIISYLKNNNLNKKCYDPFIKPIPPKPALTENQ